MIRDLLSAFAVIAIALLIYRYHRRVTEALRRFDARNVERIAEQARDRADPLAHFKHTLKVAEEQVEDVSEIVDARLGTFATRYVFEGQQFGTRREAEIVRAEKIRAIARKYYLELPAALAAREEQSVISEPEPKKPPPPNYQDNIVPFRRGDETLH